MMLGIALVLGVSIGSFLNFPVKPMALVESNEREFKLRQIIDYISYEYVDDVNTDSLLDLTIKDLLKKLDPHSSYISRDMAARSEETMRGSFEGIGIEFKLFRDTLTVVHAIPGGPSLASGIESGDRILRAGDRFLYGSDVTSRDVVNALKGESGTRVALEVYRPSNRRIINIEVERDAVAINSVPMNFMLTENTGYIKLLRFAQTSTDEIRQAISQLRDQGAERLVLDLRDNPGGLMQSAREIADEFLKDDQLIFFTSDREGNRRNYESTSRGSWEEEALAILINENAASASEIVAGAVQDNDRGWIIGRRSFGKGLVQEEITLEDGSRLRLTTQRYYTPSGRSIQKPYNSYEDYDGHAYLVGDGPFQTSAEFQAKEYFTLGGRKVHGGGGITPDHWVKNDTGLASSVIYHLSLMANFDEKAFSYIDKNRHELGQWTEDQFVEDFVVSEEILQFFLGAHAPTIINQPQPIRDLIRERIKAYMAYNIYGRAAFQRIYSNHDPYVVAALQVLDNDTP
jgi:carboxyl-terminal processing protease